MYKRQRAQRGAGHLAFSDLCAVGADRGGALAIAKAHGVAVPPVLDTLGRDGCGGDAAPIAETNPRLLAATTAFLDEALQCADAGATWRGLAADPAVELVRVARDAWDVPTLQARIDRAVATMHARPLTGASLENLGRFDAAVAEARAFVTERKAYLTTRLGL